MLLVASTAFGQEVFYDDVYFSGKKEKKEQKEEKKVIEPQKQTQRTATAAQMNALTNAKQHLLFLMTRLMPTTVVILMEAKKMPMQKRVLMQLKIRLKSMNVVRIQNILKELSVIIPLAR